MDQSIDLTVNEVARFAGCHRATVLNYERRGLLKPLRDVNGYRRFSRQDAKKLKELLELRKPAEAA